MGGSKPAGLLRPFTEEEQQALVEGHALLTRRMGLLQNFLVHLSSVVGDRSAQLQQAGAALAGTLADNAHLMDSIETSKETSQKHLSNLNQAAVNLQVSQGQHNKTLWSSSVCSPHVEATVPVLTTASFFICVWSASAGDTDTRGYPTLP
jgi:hypothetical protein